MDPKPPIFRELKKGPQTRTDLILKTGLDAGTVAITLQWMRERGYIVEEGESIRLKVVLQRPWTKQELKGPSVKIWDYQKLLAAMGPVETVPVVDFTNPFEQYQDRVDQGGIGNCCGAGLKYCAQYLYFALTGDLPTAEEMASRKHNETVNVGTAARPCILTYDKGCRTDLSHEWLYNGGRLLAFPSGNYWEVRSDAPPMGGYTDYTALFMLRVGAVTWNKCLSAKAPQCFPPYWPKDWPAGNYDYKAMYDYLVGTGFWPGTENKTDLPASWFKLVSTAAINNDFPAVVQAILIKRLNDQGRDTSGHSVYGATNLEEDYLTPDPEGTWRVHPGAEKAGGHACCFDDVRLLRGKPQIHYRGSWDKTVPDAWIGQEFYDENCGQFLVLFGDPKLKAIGKALYSLVKVTSNVSVTITIDGIEQLQPVSVMLERNKTYLIKAVPLEPEKVVEPFREVQVTPTTDTVTVPLDFTPKDVPPPPPPPTDPCPCPEPWKTKYPWSCKLWIMLCQMMRRTGWIRGDFGEPEEK